MLVVEDVLLLIMDGADGRPVVDGTAADHALAGAVLAELVSRGHLTEVGPARWSKDPRLVRRDAVLGLFPVRRYPETETGPGTEAQVRAGLAQVLTGVRAPDAREVVLLSLLDAVKGLRKVLPAETAALDDAALAARVAEVSVDPQVPAAVRKSVADARAAVDAAVMVAVMSAAAGGASST